MFSCLFFRLASALKLPNFVFVVFLLFSFCCASAHVLAQAKLLIVLAPVAPELVDETTDDSVRIKEAIVRARDAGGGTVMLKPGTYHVANPINVLENVSFKGYGREGENATIIRLVDNADSFNGRAGIVRLKDDEASIRADKRVFNVTVEDLFIDGNRDNQRQDVGDSEKKYGFYSEGDDLTIRRVTTANCMGYGFDPHGVKESDQGPAISSKNYLIEDNLSYNNLLDGFTLDHLEDSVFRNNVTYGNDRHGINIVTFTHDTVVTNSVSYNNGSNGIMVQNGSDHLTISHNHVYGNVENGIYLRASTRNILDANLIHDNQQAGIRIRGSTWNHVLNNKIFDNSKREDKSYYEIRLDEYEGLESLYNKVVYNHIESTDKGVVGEEDLADFNRILFNNYSTTDKSFVIKGDNSQEFGNEEIVVEN